LNMSVCPPALRLVGLITGEPLELRDPETTTYNIEVKGQGHNDLSTKCLLD